MQAEAVPELAAVPAALPAEFLERLATEEVRPTEES